MGPGTSIQSTAGSRDVRISGSNAGYTMYRGSVKGTGYPLHSSVFPSFPLPCVTVCHHFATGVYHTLWATRNCLDRLLRRQLEDAPRRSDKEDAGAKNEEVQNDAEGCIVKICNSHSLLLGS